MPTPPEPVKAPTAEAPVVRATVSEVLLRPAVVQPQTVESSALEAPSVNPDQATAEVEEASQIRAKPAVQISAASVEASRNQMVRSEAQSVALNTSATADMGADSGTDGENASAGRQSHEDPSSTKRASSRATTAAFAGQVGLAGQTSGQATAPAPSAEAGSASSTRAAFAASEARAAALQAAPETVTLRGAEFGGSVDVRLRTTASGVNVVLEPHSGNQVERIASSLGAIQTMLRSRGVNTNRVSLSRDKAGASGLGGEDVRDSASLSTASRQRVTAIPSGDTPQRREGGQR